ncbi:MAG: hypothetical protein V4459_08460 [Pseudomonadota bacterium]
MVPAENWVQTDEAEDVAGSLRHALRATAWTADDPQAWKWVALALHSALQGACVCHLTMTMAPVGAVTERNAGEWLTYFEASRSDPGARAPKTYLMALPDLLKAIRKPNSAGDRSNDAGIAISDAEIAWLRRFHDTVRNQFTHFEPMAWSLEVSGVPAIAALVARIVGEIAAVGWGFRHQDRAWHERLTRDLARLDQDWIPRTEARRRDDE